MSQRVLIAIPHVWVRDTVFQLISGKNVSVACAANLGELYKYAPGADVLIIDVFNFTLPFQKLMEELNSQFPSLSTIVLLPDNADYYREAVSQVGCNMAVAKENIYKELVPSLIEVIDGRKCNSLAKELLDRQNVFNNLMPKEVGYVDINKGKSSNGLTVSRRTFLKGSAAAAVVAGVAMSNPQEKILYALTEANAASSELGTGEQLVNGVCRPNCGSACRVNVHVRDGKIVKTSMKPMPDPRYNRICLRGLSHVQRINSPSRIKYPMKRVGERGEDKWERISWEEAINTITENMNRISKQYGPQANSFMSCSGSYATLSSPFSGSFTRLQNAIGATFVSISLDIAFFAGTSRVIGGTLFWNGNEPIDYSNAKTIFVWGASITEAQLQNWHFIADAIDKGAKLVVIDPFYTATAAKADLWVSVRPGSDPALALSMMQVIIEEDLTDKEFMREHTVAPFLVREDTKKYLRRSDLTGQAVAEGQDDPIMVWDEAAGQARPVNEASSAALEGTYEINGIKVNTAFSLLKDLVKQYTPETAAKITDVRPEIIRELARLYTQGPTTTVPGFGTDRYDNGQLHGHSVATLAAITGNLGKNGASCGFFIPYNPFTTIYNFTEFANPDGKKGIQIPVFLFYEAMKTGKLLGNPYPIKSLFVHVGNPVNTMGNQREWLDNVIPNMEFIAVADVEMGDTTRYADIVLPVAHWFEQEDMIWTGNNTYIQWQDKAVEPAFESKTDTDIARLMAPKLGAGKYFEPSNDDLMRILLSSPTCEKAGITLERLKEEKVLRWLPGTPDDPFVWGRDGVFPTPTGRAEFYLENPLPYVFFGQSFDADGERLPQFRPPHEAWPENPLYEKYPLVCITARERWRVHTQWSEVTWLRELDPEPTVKINPIDAEARGIKNGDLVEVFNDRGHVVLKAVLSNGIRPGMLNVARGWQLHQHVKGSCQELTGSYMNPITINQSFFDVLAEVRKA